MSKLSQSIFLQESIDSLDAVIRLETKSNYLEPLNQARSILENLYISIRMDIEESESEHDL